ncbi:MAG: hypothetical protein SVY53_11960 [Chloroflexota bacterium]|nr:hypothetical protein [Chloroflexota bacterium]
MTYDDYAEMFGGPFDGLRVRFWGNIYKFPKYEQSKQMRPEDVNEPSKLVPNTIEYFYKGAKRRDGTRIMIYSWIADLY